jgi:shikimate dehydrogenase
MRMPTGSTRLAAVIGSPVRHSLSPLLHNTAFDHLGLDWVYLAFEVPEGAAADALAAMRALDIAGLSVTMPHKEAVADLCDDLSADAQALRAVNCVVNDGGRLIGHNTDGDGFIASLADELSLDPAGQRCVVLGAGGAARSIGLALARNSASQVAIVNRTEARAREVAALFPDLAMVVNPDDAASVIADSDLIINATSVGMGAAPDDTVSAAFPFDPELIGSHHTVVDIVYRPLITPLLAQAQVRGARTANGVAMLTHQAAIAFSLWTGQTAPIEAMSAAVSTLLVD